MKNLIIVESPNKIKKLGALLDGEFTIMASVGHIRDLPEKSMGVEAPDYRPQYVVTKPDVVQKLIAASKGADVILATDPDREGEAIAFHLREVLGLKNPKRVAFNELTGKAVRAAIASPRLIDENLVHAQEARRVLDRLVGYRASNSLSNAAGQRLSAGRVQTPAVRIVVDREREIEAFRSVDYYAVEALFNSDGIEWAATWNFKPYLEGDAALWTDRDFAASVAALRNFKVAGIEKAEKNRGAPAPFTTSTLQQAASIKLKMKPARTMELAQNLFADGLITYHRTDTPNLSEEATGEIWAYLRDNDMAAYVPASRNTWKAKEGAQEAHEAIRPTHFNDRKPDIKDADAARLYELIWLRAVACQMKAEVFDVTTIRLESLDVLLNNSRPEFIASGRVQRFDGWRKLTGEDAASEDAEEVGQGLPALVEGEALTATGGKVVDKKTKPPARFSEASLIKELEAQGIGRPSTYASIMATISTRCYVAEEKGRLIPTALGCKVVDALVGKFAFAELSYTRGIEADFDQIAEGKSSFKAVVSAADSLLSEELGKLDGAEVGEVHPCPDCGKPMRRKKGPSGYFWGCSGYPDCKQTMPDKDGAPGAVHNCPECGKSLRKLVAKKGPNTGKPFWSCSGYPDCKYSADDKKGVPVKKK